ncbi:APEH enzyme, partial [Nothoprocta ornata]|nr:APEH enzyme [Nothoprocta ornata]
FGCLAWSHSETHLLYVAEKKRPKGESFFQGKAAEAGGEELGGPQKQEAPAKGEQFVYREGWGETLGGRSTPVLCVLDVEGSSVSVLEGVPEHVSPGQAFWAPEDTGVVFVGWWHEPFRLGLRHCTNRRSALFYVDLAGGKCELLSDDTQATWSPRLSPDRCRVAYLQNSALGPHQQCSRLCVYDWYTGRTRTVLEAVPRAAAGESGVPRAAGRRGQRRGAGLSPGALVAGAFPGIYCSALPGLCWAADSRRLLLDTVQRSQQDIFVVDTQTGAVTPLTADAPQGSWSLLTIDRDILVASFSTPSCPPKLVVGLLPPAGQEPTLQWVHAEAVAPVPGVSWKTLTLQPPGEEQSPPARGDGAPGPPAGAARRPTLTLCPGGPHAVFDARWRPPAAALCQLGFAVLMGECGTRGGRRLCPHVSATAPVPAVNYRGSLGFGQAALASLLARQGEQDVADTQLAAERALRDERLDRRRVALLGASHGAFVALHLLARHPELYRACAVRSPVTDLATLLGTSDIP